MEEQARTERKAEREKKRRRIMLFRRIKVGAILCIVLAVVLYLLSAFVFFKIEAIEVTGIEDENGNILPASSYYSLDEIIKVSGVDTGDSLVRVSRSEVERNIEKLLPYVGNVSVKRKYPSTLKIITEDTHAVYGADAGGGYTLMNENYKVLGVAERRPQGCMKLVGVSFESSETGETAVFTDEAYKSRINTITEACDNAGVKNITKLDLSNIANVKIVINSRVTIILGTITDLSEKLSMGLKTMEAELKNASEAKIIIDVTDSERSYVRDDYSPIEDEEETTDVEPIPDEEEMGNEAEDEPADEENAKNEEEPIQEAVG